MPEAAAAAAHSILVAAADEAVTFAHVVAAGLGAAARPAVAVCSGVAVTAPAVCLLRRSRLSCQLGSCHSVA